MSKAEDLLLGRQCNNESIPLTSPFAEVQTPSPGQQPEDMRLSVDHVSSSGSMACSGNKRHLNKKSFPCVTKNKVFKKKKKCLSDIFGHVVGASKDQHSTTYALKDEPKDSPYADLDSVPMLHRPKRTEMSSVQDLDRYFSKEHGSLTSKAKCTDNMKNSTDSSNSSNAFQTSKNAHSEQKSGSWSESLDTSTGKHSLDFPASSRLMTKALKAEGDADLNDALATKRISADVHTDARPHASPTDTSIKKEMSSTWESPSKSSSCNTQRAVKRRARKPDKKQMQNGSCTASKRYDSTIEPVQPVKIKTEINVPEISTSGSPSLSLSPVDAFQNVKELTFKSLGKDEQKDSEVNVFHPDSSYQFSTYLMLLKDIHDTREKEGKPLTLPPTPVLIKEEPMLIPTSTGGVQLKGSCDALTQNAITPAIKTETIHSPSNKSRTKGSVNNHAIKCEGLPIYSEGTEKQRRKQRLPAKLKVSLSSDHANPSILANGEESVRASAHLAKEASDTSCKTFESIAASKKPMPANEETEERCSEGASEEFTEVNGSHARELELEDTGGVATDFSDTSTCGKSPTCELMKRSRNVICVFVCFHRAVKRQTPSETN